MIDREFLAFISSAINKTDYVAPAELDYRVIADEIVSQTIVGLTAERFCTLPRITMEEKNRITIQYLREKYLAEKILQAQKELIELLREGGYNPVILKGYAAGYYYPEPGKRTMGDIDYLLSEEEFEPSIQYLLGAGYELRDGDKYKADHHMPLKKGGIVFEPHRAPAGLPEGERGVYVMQLLKQSMREPQIRIIMGVETPMLSEIENGLVLLLHIRHHVSKSGLGLRQIIDWMMFARRNLVGEKYDSKWEDTLTRSGLLMLAKTVTKLCVLFFGLEGDFGWYQDVPDEQCEILMEYLLDQGNFGTVNGTLDSPWLKLH